MCFYYLANTIIIIYSSCLSHALYTQRVLLDDIAIYIGASKQVSFSAYLKSDNIGNSSSSIYTIMAVHVYIA